MTTLRFCLLMIVRDESSIIQRCLDSVKNLTDCYLICDTGSTDDTIEKIQNIMRDNKKVGEVISHPWKDFGYNKTYLLEQFQKHPICSKAEYIFWLDADEVFLTKNDEYLSEKNVNELYECLKSKDEKIFMVKTHFGNLEYWRRQMARNVQTYRWEYPVHELFVGAEDDRCTTIELFYDLARKEGNSSRNPDRYKRDVEMFENFLKEHPGDARATFYLAQSAEGIDNKKAIEEYKKRLDLAGYYDEKYISCLRLGRLCNNIDDKHKYWTEGTYINPSRLETIYELMMYYHSKDDHNRAFSVGLMAGNNRENRDFLFCEKYIYDWAFDLNFSVSAFYAGKYEIAYKYGLDLYERKTYPDYHADKVKSNLDFFRKHSKSVLTVCHYVPTVIIIDNFYDNPDKIREFALSQKFETKGNYPGLRTVPFATEDDKKKLESILQRNITYWPQDNYNGSFQIVTKNDRSWIHRDNTDYSMLVFLTPNPPPQSGTILYKHKPTGLEKSSNEEEERLLSQDTYNENQWEIVDRIGNKYNRAIVFHGKLSHMSDRYFGEDKETGRLFQTFFFDIAK